MRYPAQNVADSRTDPSETCGLPPVEDSQPSEPTVFVVEDDAHIRRILCLLVKSAGIPVESYATAQAFLAAYDPGRPGCVLLDIFMPGMNGIELQERLTAQKRRPAIIFLTGSADVPTALQAVRAGAFDFIQKPFQRSALLNRVREAITRDHENRKEHAACEELETRRAQLTAREGEVLEMIAQGQNTKGIASRLGISPKTVDKHRAKVLEKMQVDSPLELAYLLLSHAVR